MNHVSQSLDINTTTNGEYKIVLWQPRSQALSSHGPRRKAGAVRWKSLGTRLVLWLKYSISLVCCCRLLCVLTNMNSLSNIFHCSQWGLLLPVLYKRDPYPSLRHLPRFLSVPPPPPPPSGTIALESSLLADKTRETGTSFGLTKWRPLYV